MLRRPNGIEDSSIQCCNVHDYLLRESFLQAEGQARAIREKALAQSSAILEIADALAKGGHTDRAAQLNIAREVRRGFVCVGIMNKILIEVL